MTQPPIFPPTETLRLETLGVDLEVWSGRFDIVVPFYADARLASEVRPLDMEAAQPPARARRGEAKAFGSTRTDRPSTLPRRCSSRLE